MPLGMNRGGPTEGEAVKGGLPIASIGCCDGARARAPYVAHICERRPQDYGRRSWLEPELASSTAARTIHIASRMWAVREGRGGDSSFHGRSADTVR